MKKILALFMIATLFLTSCNLAAQEVNQANIQTAAALTVQAALTTQTPLATATLAAAPNQNAAPAETAQSTATAENSEARANFDDVVNCRQGPGMNYDRVFQTKPGDSFKIVGFFPPNFWIISTSAGECWISGEFATPVGSLQAVPTVTMPPTPMGGAPDAPSFSKNGWQWFCYGSGQVEVELAWNDNSNAEKGYRIYRNDELVTELAANSTYFKEVIAYPGGQGLLYRIEAFNEIGAASVSTQVLFCD